jgi:hypothetical protein
MLEGHQEAAMSPYAAPLDQLLTLGRPDHSPGKFDYRTLGIGPEHVPELIRLATEPVSDDVPDDDPSLYASIHAWRALGQVGGVAALPTFYDLLRQNEGDDFSDWIVEDFPEIFADMGPAVLSHLAEFLRDATNGLHTRTDVASGLEHLAIRNPELRGECVRVLTDVLAAMPADPELNGFLVADLLELKAVESAAVIEQAFAAGRVDESIAGDWPWVRYDLGLGPKPPPRRPIRQLPLSGGRSPRERAEDRKARRKRERKARKRNRKRH